MYNFEEGEVILLDKPIDWTSFDTVNFIRALIKRFYGIRKLKVGHAGTLDPLAMGLLILCTGRKTKQIEEYQAKIKTYTGTILLGQTTPTFDLESDPDAFFDGKHYAGANRRGEKEIHWRHQAVSAEVFRHQNQGQTRF